MAGLTLFFVTRTVSTNRLLNLQDNLFHMADGNKTYMVKANGFEFSFTDAEISGIDLIKTSAAEFNLLKDHRSINARLTETDATGKKLKIEIEGEDFFVEIQDELDQQWHAAKDVQKPGQRQARPRKQSANHAEDDTGDGAQHHRPEGQHQGDTGAFEQEQQIGRG